MPEVLRASMGFKCGGKELFVVAAFSTSWTKKLTVIEKVRAE